LNVGATPMQDTDKDGTWEVVVMLAPGAVPIQTVADGKWITDTNSDGFAPDGFGGQNSILNVDDRFATIDVKRGDGKFYVDDLKYGLDYATVNPMSPTRLVFTARAHLNDVEKIFVVVREGDGADRSIEMAPAGEDPALEYRRATVDLASPAGPVRFTFRYVDGGKELFVTPHGKTEQTPAPEARFSYTPQTLPVFEVPEWAQNGVIYQIFADRFRNGDPSNDPQFNEPMYSGRTALPASGKTNAEYFHLVKDWKDIGGLVTSPYRTDGRPDYYSFYGGDIAGVREKLPYLQDSCHHSHFNPLNVARSNHKYDPCDYLARSALRRRCHLQPSFKMRTGAASVSSSTWRTTTPAIAISFLDCNEGSAVTRTTIGTSGRSGRCRAVQCPEIKPSKPTTTTPVGGASAFTRSSTSISAGYRIKRTRCVTPRKRK
jgi:hypothetical protein